ncbi:hypothetical protein P9139_01825 [Curtobacterium flaccumfaciens]|nr:hypothetical protein P9139_01825 [Curtobacterium flaccumfaciens]
MTDTMSVPTHRLVPATRPVAARRASSPAVAPAHADHEYAPAWMRAVGAALLIGGLGLTAAVLGWPGRRRRRRSSCRRSWGSSSASCSSSHAPGSP